MSLVVASPEVSNTIMDYYLKYAFNYATVSKYLQIEVKFSPNM